MTAVAIHLQSVGWALWLYCDLYGVTVGDSRLTTGKCIVWGKFSRSAKPPHKKEYENHSFHALPQHIAMTRSLEHVSHI